MTKKVASPTVADKTEDKKVPISWVIPDDVITRWASNITVQCIENDFKISFFELKPQVYFGGPVPTEAKAICVASVIVSVQRLPKFIKALQSQLDRVTMLASESPDS